MYSSQCFYTFTKNVMIWICIFNFTTSLDITPSVTILLMGTFYF